MSTTIPWNINALAAFVSLGGMFFGMDTGLIGPVTVMPQFLKQFPEVKSETIQGTLVATILMAAAVSSFSSGSISDRLSRRKTIMLGAFIAAIGCFLEAGAIKFWMLVLGRVIAGLGEGLFLNTIGVYLVEISPPSVRGRTGCTFQLLITIGVATGYFICYGSVTMASTFSFRLPFLVQGVICSILALGCPLIPCSPRWLASHGREEEAWEVISMFDPSGAAQQCEKMQEALRREEEFRTALRREQAIMSGTGGSNPVLACLNQVKQNDHVAAVSQTFKKDARGRTIFAIVFMGLQQLSGIDGVLFYAPILFSQAGLSSRKASFLASGVTGIINFLATIPSLFWLMDRWGRRPTCIAGAFVMSICMTCIGAMYASGLAKQPGGRWVVIVFIYIFIAAFAMTWAPAGKVLITEMQPSQTRATASSLAQSSNWVVNVVVALTTPVFLSKSPSGPYFVFGGFLLLAAFICILWAPETLGKTLEDIDAVWTERTDLTKQLLRLHPTRTPEANAYLQRYHPDVELAVRS